MDLKQLRYFMTVAEMGQITSAAKKLFIAQPALSHSLKALEDELGVTLFERFPSGIRLTGAGVILLNKSYEILEKVDDISINLAAFRDGLSGTLNLGMVSSSGSMLINEAFVDFHASFPEVKLNLYEGNSYQIIEFLKKGIIEIGIIRTPFEEELFNQYRQAPTPMVAATHKNKFPFTGSQIDITDLVNHPIIINRRYHDILEKICQEESIKLNFYCLNNDARTTLHFARAGLGIGIVPKEVVKMTDFNDITYVEINHPALFTNIAMIWMPNKPLSKVAMNFIGLVKENTNRRTIQ